MSDIHIGSNEISLIKQKIQKHYIKLVVLNQCWNEKGVIEGRLISGNINIDGSSNIRRTASLSMIVDILSLKTVAQISMDTYIQIKCGLTNNSNGNVSWYNFGYFIVNQNSFKFDPTTRTLDLSLSDLMMDLTGDRAGVLHAYTSLVKNEQRIDDVMVNVLKLAGFTDYNIAAFSLVRSSSSAYDTDNDFEENMIPYNIDFNVGISAYEILDRLVNLYPFYEMYFDTHGTFTVDRMMMEQNTSNVLIDDKNLRGLVISEDTSVDYSKVKNHIEVWGKDGKCYGEAKDENPLSPFNIHATQDLRMVISGGSEQGIDTNNICDKYKDADKQVIWEKEMAGYETEIANYSKIENPTRKETEHYYNMKSQLNLVKSNIATNIAYKGDDLAQQWAEHILYQKARLNDTITLQTVFLPFVTDVNFKISYCTKLDNQTRTYLVAGVSHDLTGGTTTLTCVRFYNDNVNAYWDALPDPTISYVIDGMTLVVTVTPVTNATKYQLMLDGKIVATTTGTTLVYTLDDEFEGIHTFYVRACADGWRDGKSASYTIEFIADTLVVTNMGDEIITNNDENIIATEVE